MVSYCWGGQLAASPASQDVSAKEGGETCWGAGHARVQGMLGCAVCGWYREFWAIGQAIVEGILGRGMCWAVGHPEVWDTLGCALCWGIGLVEPPWVEDHISLPDRLVRKACGSAGQTGRGALYSGQCMDGGLH